MSKETIENLVNAYFQNMGAMNAEGWLENFAKDAIIYDPVGNPPTKPHEDFEKFFGMLSNFFNKLEVSPEQIFISGNSAAVKWTMLAFAKNGQNAKTEGISVFNINEADKIQEIYSYWDEAKMMAQLKV